jgi:uncharacterized protein (DUF2252 family)
MAVLSDIKSATRQFETWMRGCTSVVEGDLVLKHKEMKKDVFSFLRGTFYRWAQLWPAVCEELCAAPRVLAVGDLHVNSFGTWRDHEGRLCWGVDDFDESFPLPYTNDLVRLATSVKIVIDAQGLALKLSQACDAIIASYRQTLKRNGCPFVLAEHEERLANLGVSRIKAPVDFWEKLRRLPSVDSRLPNAARQILQKELPARNLDYKVVRRVAGLGSLGQERFVAIANWNGGYIAREAKAMVPSACSSLVRGRSRRQSYYEKAIGSAVRSVDPFQRIDGDWLIRRLSPDSNPIDIEELPKERDEEVLLGAMGSEAANVHLGTAKHAEKILSDLNRRKSNWLRDAAKEMARHVEKEWKEFRRG